MKYKLALLNSTVLTNNGIFKLTDLSLEEARNLVLQNLDNLENCIGHQATALTDFDSVMRMFDSFSLNHLKI